MGIFAKIKSALLSVGQVEDLIKKWKPRSYETEKGYEESLKNYLEKKLEGIEIIKQYGKGRARVDLAAGNKIFIELKKDLKTTGQLQRLIGQLEIYAKNLDNIIIVICGEVDKSLFKQLMDKKGGYDWNIGFDCKIVQK